MTMNDEHTEPAADVSLHSIRRAWTETGEVDCLVDELHEVLVQQAKEIRDLRSDNASINRLLSTHAEEFREVCARLAMTEKRLSLLEGRS